MSFPCGVFWSIACHDFIIHEEWDLKGEAREKSLPLDVYFSGNYFSLPTLFSLSQQIHGIHAMKPKSILEIGPGNGLVSSFLKRSGVDVVTVDINPALEPDICAPLSEIRQHLDGRRFDMVVCCEVLEHMPFEQFEGNVQTMREIGDRLFMTLPNYRKSFGFGGIVRLPMRPAKPFGMYLTYWRNRKLADEHFWEIGYSKECSLGALMTILRRYYNNIETKKFEMNAYHQAFTAQ